MAVAADTVAAAGMAVAEADTLPAEACEAAVRLVFAEVLQALHFEAVSDPGLSEDFE